MPMSHNSLIMDGSAGSVPGSLGPQASVQPWSPGVYRWAPELYHVTSSPSPIISLGHFKLHYSGTFSFPDIKRCYLSLQVFPFISISPHSVTPCPKHFSSPRAFINTMLICLSWEQKSFPLLTLIHIFIYLLTVLYSCLFLLVMKETGCSSILVGFPQSKNMLFISV